MPPTISSNTHCVSEMLPYSFHVDELSNNAKTIILAYNEQSFKWNNSLEKRKSIDDFVVNDNSRISWSEGLKKSLARGIILDFYEVKIRESLYRPFTKSFLFYDAHLNERRYQFPIIFPTQSNQLENIVLSAGGYGRKQFAVIATNLIPNLNLYADPQQSFPFYIYDKEGNNRQENITDWSLEQF